MKVAGIIAEYNPLHNGHIYQLSQTDADIKIAVMSGNFVQRGEPALWDKWTRAKYAVQNGVDLVLELPVDYAVASAERFAFGGVFILNALGVVDTISFGAENPLSDLQQAADALCGHDFEVFLKNGILKEMPYHAARNARLADSKLIQSPNNILAVEYLKALNKLHSAVQPQAVLRKGAGHDAQKPQDNFASASYIRQALTSGLSCTDFMPQPIPDINPVTAEDFYPFLRYKILTSSLTDIAEIREGIENRMYQAALNCNNFESLVSAVKTKRYTQTAVCRMLTLSFLGIRKQDLASAPIYTRLLAANAKGREILKTIRKHAQIPVITKGANAPKCREFDLDVRAGNLYKILQNSSSVLNDDYTKKPFMENCHD